MLRRGVPTIFAARGPDVETVVLARAVRAHLEDKIVVHGQGLDAQGEGRAEAVVTAKLEPLNDTTTRVLVDTSVTLTGRVAQLGKGVIPEVSTNLMAQFADNLAASLDGPVVVGLAAADGDRS